jgi:hypothetical protein
MVKIGAELEEYLKASEEKRLQVLNLFPVKYLSMFQALQNEELNKLKLISMLNVLIKLIKLKNKLKKVKRH